MIWQAAVKIDVDFAKRKHREVFIPKDFMAQV